MGKSPNIVFVFPDSWDGRLLGCAGHPAMRNATPNVDALARRGARFTNAYTTHPLCCPARANLWSGRYTQTIESWTNCKGIDAGSPTFKTALEGSGYAFATEEGGFGKHDYLSGRHSVKARVCGWTGVSGVPLPVCDTFVQDVTIEDGERSSRSVGRGDYEAVAAARAFLRDRAADERPFFLYVGTETPHPPFNPCRKYLDMVDVEAIPIPAPEEQTHPAMQYMNLATAWKHGFSEDTVRQFRAAYCAMCAETDAMVGEIAGSMDELGLAENTYFVLCSDHGELALEHGAWLKMAMYEGSTHIPLIIAGPGVTPGARIDRIVSLIDLHPTFLDLAGAAPDPGAEGESLRACLTDPNAPGRDWAYACYCGTAADTFSFMLRKDEWKYVAYIGREPQLFNLRTDPDERRDLAATRPGMVAELDACLRRIVDPEETYERFVRYCKQSFTAWREEAKQGLHSYRTANAYEEIMRLCYTGWSREHEEHVNRWLAEDAGVRK